MSSPIDPPGAAREPAAPGRPMQLHKERVRIIAEHNRAGTPRRPAAVDARSAAVAAEPLAHAPATNAAGPAALPRAVLRSLRRRWPILLVTALLGLGLGVFLGREQAPVYQATTTVFFSLDRGQTVNEFAAGVTYTQDLVPSYAAIATQPLVLDPVITALKLPVSSAELARQIDVSTPSGTTLIDITVTDPSPTVAAAIANQVSTQLSGVVATLSPRGPENTPSLRVTATSPATESTQPVAVNPLLLAAAGLLGGLLIGLALLVAVEAVTRPVRHRQDLAGLTSAPVLGAIAADRQAGRHPLPLLTDDAGQRAEDFRYLRANLGLLGDSRAAVRAGHLAAGRRRPDQRGGQPGRRHVPNVPADPADRRRPAFAERGEPAGDHHARAVRGAGRHRRGWTRRSGSGATAGSACCRPVSSRRTRASCWPATRCDGCWTPRRPSTTS